MCGPPGKDPVWALEEEPGHGCRGVTGWPWASSFLLLWTSISPPVKGKEFGQIVFYSRVDKSCWWQQWCLVIQLRPTLCDPMDCSATVSLSMGFPRQEYWSGLPCPSIGELPDPRIASGSLALQADSLPAEPPGKPNQFPWNSLILYRIFQLILELSTLFRINKNRVYRKIIDVFMSSEGNTSLLAHRIYMS